MCAQIDDLELEVESRLIVISHVWPGLTPFNIYDLTLDMWLRYSKAADLWAAARER